jgi:hypothetical protein
MLIYGASTAITISLASLASSATWVAGRNSSIISNATDLFLDVLLSGKIRVGTTPVAGTSINVFVYAQMDDTPTYPDSLTGSDAAFTCTSAGITQGYLMLARSLMVDSATSDRDYPFSGVSIARLFDGFMPQRWGVFVSHNTGVALNSTGGNHVLKYQGGK